MMHIAENVQLLRSSTGRRALWRAARRKVYSRRVAIGIHRDLTQPHSAPRAKIPLQVRQLRHGDDLTLVSETAELEPRRAQERADQRWFLGSDLPTPWVAVDPDGTLCFITWVLRAQDNEAMCRSLGPLLPDLQPYEVAIEGAFTAESHRGLGILPDVATRLVDQAAQSGEVRRGLAYIAEWNAASLKAGEKAGWVPFGIREERWVMGRRSIRFSPLKEGLA